MRYSGPDIILREVIYRTFGNGHGSGHVVSLDAVKYLGVLERKSDGYTVLSVQKHGSIRAFNIEVGAVISLVAHGNFWQPEAPSLRHRIRAAELRAFIEQADLEEWAKPYFDPDHPKYHAKKSPRR